VPGSSGDLRRTTTVGRKLMPIQGMTCADCQAKVTEALVRAGARDVRVDYRLGEVRLDPAAATEERLRSAVEELGYRAGSLRAIPATEAGRGGGSSGAWGFLFLLLPLVCCGGPLLLVAIAASGAGAWLAANRLLVASGVALIVALAFAGLWIRRRGGPAR